MDGTSAVNQTHLGPPIVGTGSLLVLTNELTIPHCFFRMKLLSHRTLSSGIQASVEQHYEPDRGGLGLLAWNERAAQANAARISRLAARMRTRTPQEAALAAVATT